MICERFYLDEERCAYLDSFAFPSAGIDPKDAILIIPGGGYEHVSLEREGESIAIAYASRGLSAFVLNYTTPPKNPDQPLIEAASAISYIKKNAEHFSINPNRVFVIGFSAGGHLAGTLSLHHKKAEKLLGLAENFARPTGTIYGYPVVTAMNETHVGSFQNLLGMPFSNIDEATRREYSNELAVTPDSPPAFIWHTATDDVVPPYGSLRLCESYIRAGVKVELHLYPEGPHGTALCKYHTSAGIKNFVIEKAQSWLDESVSFMKLVP